MKYMFYECNIENLDLFSFNTKKVKFMDHMFGCCKILKKLDMLSFDITNVSNINRMFDNCSLLISLPDNISTWNTENIKDMSGIFNGCSSLQSLPDISKWKLDNITNLNEIFSGCSSLISLPDISKWNTRKVINLNKLFNGCSLLKSLPDISKWDLKSANNISGMFSECSSLESLPDISKWNLENIKDIRQLFKGCSQLKTIPDISKWNTENIKNISEIFSGCSSLTSIPDSFRWNNTSSKLKETELNIENPIKIVLTGDSGVGCNSLSIISCGESFPDEPAVLLWRFRKINFNINKQNIEVNIWNGPGQETYLPYYKLFVKDADIIIFVYDITMPNSLKDLIYRIQIAKEINDDKFIGAIVSNKNDLYYYEEVIDEEQGKKFAHELKYKFYQASAKNDPKGFINFLEELVEDYQDNLIKEFNI